MKNLIKLAVIVAAVSALTGCAVTPEQQAAMDNAAAGFAAGYYAQQQQAQANQPSADTQAVINQMQRMQQHQDLQNMMQMQQLRMQMYKPF